jgi:multidrug resistance protein MdtO
MAKRVDSGRPDFLSSVAELLAPFPGRLEFAARLALICALTVLIVETYQNPDAALTAYLAFFVMKPDRASSAVTGAVLIVVITLTLLLILPIVIFAIDDPMWRVVAMTVMSFCLLFAASASKLKPIGAIVALIVGYAVDLLGQIQIGEIATRALLYAWLFVAIPAGVSIGVNLLLGPAPRRLLEKALARRLRLSADVLGQADEATCKAFTESLREGASEVPELLKAANLEGTSPPENTAALQQACGSTAAIQSLVDLIIRDPQLLPVPERMRLARTLDLVADFLAQGQYPTEIGFAPDAERPDLQPLNAAMIAELNDVLATFAETPPLEASPERKPTESGSFFLADAFTDPIHVHYAIKTTAAAIFCYIVYQLLDWPGIHTCMITCYIVSLARLPRQWRS